MPELIPHAPDNPDFARVIEPRLIREADAFPFDIAPTPAEAAAIARLLGARDIRKLRFKGALSRLPKGGWRLEATLGATAVQTCVVTLDPVTTRVDQPVTRTFLPAAATASAEVVVDLDDDEIEPLGDRIDLGLVAIEALALALPNYPRRPGATLGPASAAGHGVAPLDEAELKPFAALAALRGKSGHGS
jgi:uncharacterized metal-binding protein YceD (DUF177 family)